MNEATVLVLRGINCYLTYAVPDSLSHIVPGMTVQVPLGKGSAKGIVLGVSPRTQEYAKPILEILENHSIISEELLKLIDFIQWHYGVSPYTAYQTVIGQKKNRPVVLKPVPPLSKPHILNAEQAVALQEISKRLHQYEMALLHGITGSGKTEIYLQLAMMVKDQDKQTILLVPEISLTPQLTDLFKQRFGSEVGVLHSHQTPKQKEIEWSKIIEGHSKIIIGPRSAIFSPVSRLGLVIIDEEHDHSYKQDSAPRYWTHKIAEFRCKMHQALLLLGSATPCLETYTACQKRDTIFTLSKRATAHQLPDIYIIDMRNAYLNGSKGIISDDMIEKLTDRLEKKEKSLILLNRRGFSTYICCLKCKKIMVCPGCQLSYTYHQDRYLRCHRCQKSVSFQPRCPYCASHKLAMSGLGIQKLEAELKLRFPFAKIFRLDKDTAKTLTKIESTLTSFKDEGDILIGTQMIAKGHDISDITFVGVLGIDTTLHLPDYTASERTFQLLLQVAGRCGRGDKKGEVMIQTFESDHPAITYAQQHDYLGFLNLERSFREDLYYPPFCDIIHLIWSGKTRHEVHAQAKQDVEALQLLTSDTTQVLGPKPAPIEMIKNHYRVDALIKYQVSDFHNIKKQLDTLPSSIKSVKRIIDIDPKQLL